MSALTNIIKKEVKELLTPATILPIVFVAILFGSIGNTIGDIGEEASQAPTIALINEQNTSYSSIASKIIYNNAEVVYNSTDISNKEIAFEKLKEKEGIALFIIPKDFSENIKNNNPGEIEIFWIMEGAGIMNSISSSSVENILWIINNHISKTLIKDNSSLNASVVLSPITRSETTNFKGIDFKDVSPSVLIGMMASQSMMIPIIMMMIIIISGQMVISSMALEKENKTLETLLTLPIKRTSIVSGKILASAIVGLFLALIYMIGMGYYMMSFNIGSSIGTVNIDLSMSMFDILLFGILLFITLVAALSLCMLLGTMAKNYKSAQTLIFPVVLMSMFPMFITMFTDFDTLPLAFKTLLFAIPFSHPMMAPRALMFDDYLFVIGGIIYVSIFTVIVIALVVWIFKTDRLLTGSINKNKIFEYRKKFFKR